MYISHLFSQNHVPFHIDFPSRVTRVPGESPVGNFRQWIIPLLRLLASLRVPIALISPFPVNYSSKSGNFATLVKKCKCNIWLVIDSFVASSYINVCDIGLPVSLCYLCLMYNDFLLEVKCLERGSCFEVKSKL